MTRKDFCLIAAAIADARAAAQASGCVDQVYAVEQAARTLATALASTNPRFDRARFIAACAA